MEANETDKSAVMMIEFGVTRQPESYQSVRCNVTLPVWVRPGDDVEEIAREKLMFAKQTVRIQVDDEFERGYEKPAVYSQEQRFCMMAVKDEKLVVIAPWGGRENMPAGWRERGTRFEAHRLSFVARKVNEEYPGYRVIDCADGDWSRLPGLELFRLFNFSPNNRAQMGEMLVLVKDGATIPGKDDYPGWWNSTTHFRLYGEKFLEEMRAKAKNGFFDCTDGDFSKLPAPPPVEPEPEPDDDLDDDNDDFEDDDGHGDDED